MDIFDERRTALQTLVDTLGRGGINAIAQKIGKDPSYVSRLLYPAGKNGAKRIGEDTAIALAKAFPTHFHLNTGLLPAVSLPTAPDESPFWHHPDAIRVPLLANSGSMGPGHELLEGDVIVGDLALSPHWINRYIKPQNPMELRFIHAEGDSMSPTFTDGDILLVDTGGNARDPSSREGIYVLQAHGHNYVKRVTRLMNGQLQVSSDNPSARTVEVLNGDHEVKVLGRVVWAWNGRRL